MVVVIHSQALGEEVCFASDMWAARKSGLCTDRIIYTAEELEQIMKTPLSDKDLQALHAVKRQFAGRITGVGTNSLPAQEDDTSF